MPRLSVEQAISEIKIGKQVIIIDDEDRENEGDLAMAAEHVTPDDITFMATYGRGLICVPMMADKLEALNLPMMVQNNTATLSTAFTISVDALSDTSTGISAKDRSVTIKTAIKPNVKKNEIISPGHIFPIISKDGGVLVRAGHTEASVDISRLAKKNPSAVICEIMNDRGVMAKGKELFNFAKKHKLKIGRIDDLIAYRLKVEKLIKFKKSDKILIKNQKYNIKIFENLLDSSENFALVKGDLKKSKNPRVRVISSNIVQNYLMGQKLPNSFNKTIDHFKHHKECALIFIRDTNLKSVSQTLRDYKSNKFYKKGQDKLIKNYGIGAQIIKALNIKNMILVTRSKKKVVGLDGYGIKITKQEIIK